MALRGLIVMKHQFKKGHKVNLGRKHSKETKIKMSKSAKKNKHNSGRFTLEKWSNKSFAKKITDKIKSVVSKPEVIEKKKTAMRMAWKDPIKKQNYLKARKYQKRPMKDTSIEIKIQNYLKEIKIEFFTHQYINIKNSYQCDILIPSVNLIIECDGDYWHGNSQRFPNKKFPEYIKKRREVDKLRTKQLIEMGFKVWRLWESEINTITLADFKSMYEGKI